MKQHYECFDCDGIMEEVVEPFTLDTKEYGRISILNVPIIRCPDCGERLIGAEGSKVIEDTIKSQYPLIRLREARKK